MEFEVFRRKINKLLETNLPSGHTVVREGRSLSGDIRIGRTAFMKKKGVSSEAEYKRICMKNGKIMFHAHVGMGNWRTTAEALKHIYRASLEGGFTVDRAGICLDRRMGLPQKQRGEISAETGPVLKTGKDWEQLGQCVPIQPHMGDFMIGFPASVENTINALRTGITTIGNLSQYFAHEVPSWRNPAATTVETVRALSLMSSLRQRGAVVHSYLEDGFGALFNDCSTVAGWAFLEHYIIEHLLGGKLAHCIGGLTTDPVKRAGWIFALKEIHGSDCLGSMVYGDTISFGDNYASNRGVVSEYLLWDIMAQLECPTGHAVLPLPVTESLRIPSAEEISEAQSFGKRIEQSARRLRPQLDFSPAYQFSGYLISAGKAVFQRALDGFKEAGADIKDPVQLLYLLKLVGPAVFESMFAKRSGNDGDMHQQSGTATDVSLMIQQCVDQNRSLFSRPEVINRLKGKRLLIASTDVHEYAIRIIGQLLSDAGADMIYLGAEKDPEEVAAKAAQESVDAVLISTHNGMALEYAARLKKVITTMDQSIPVIMGGVLNQKYEDKALPIDVSKELKQLGFRPCAQLGRGIDRLLE
jgi:methylmalonyl-CoA mutase cobalamin-binding domain/chain